MTISIDKIVNVLPRTINSGSSNYLELNGMIISSNDFIPNDNILEFNSSESVGKYFGIESKEYKLSINYFLGFSNSTKKPNKLLFAKDLTKEASPACLFGGKVEQSIDSLRLIENGSLVITIDNETIELNDISLTNIKSYSDIAVTIQDKLDNKCKVVYSSINNNFIIKSSNTNTLSYCKGTLADLLGLSEESSIFLSQSSDVIPIAENMDRIKNISLNWVSFMTIDEEIELNNKLAYATWTNSENYGCRFVYLCQDSDDGCKFGELLKEKELNGTSIQYNSTELCAFVAGMIASINYDVKDGRITFTFKQQDGLDYTVDDNDLADKLLANSYNFYGSYSNSNNNYKFYQNSSVFGKHKWLDSLINAIWLNDKLQSNILDLMLSVNSLPYNERSYNLIINACQDSLTSATENGVISKSIELTNSQKLQLEQEAGLDISNSLYMEGYYFQVLNPSAKARETRETPIANLWYCDGGSIQKLTINSTIIL